MSRSWLQRVLFRQFRVLGVKLENDSLVPEEKFVCATVRMQKCYRILLI